MSFSSDLWNSITKIQKEFCLKFNELYNITEVFKRLSNAEMNFADQIKKICLLNNKPKNCGLLGNTIKQFFQFLNNIYNIYQNHANTLNDWIISPTEKFLSEQITETNLVIEEIIRKEQYFALKAASLEAFRKEYHSCSTKLIQSTIKLEETIAKNNIIQEELKIEMENQRKSNDNLRISKMEYINYLDKFNDFRENHNTKIKKDLNLLQSYYLEIVKFYKWEFLTSEKYSKEFLKKLKAENKTIEIGFHALMPENDLQEFIEKNRSTAFPMQRCEFIHYKIDNNLLNNLTFPNNVIENIKEFIKEEVKYVQPKKDDYTKDNMKLIEEFILTSWNGEIDQITKSFIIGLLKESKSNRINLLDLINTYRPKGMFKITDETYSLLIELLTVVLNYCLIDFDYETIKSVIIISQTFYKQNENDAKDKEDLQAGLMGHPIFHKRDIWEGIIKYSINEDLKKKKELCKSSTSKDIKKMKNLTMIILITNTFNMSTFGVSNDIIKDITDYFCKLYQINEDMLKSAENTKKQTLNISNKERSSSLEKYNKPIEDLEQPNSSNNNNKGENGSNITVKVEVNSQQNNIKENKDKEI